MNDPLLIVVSVVTVLTIVVTGATIQVLDHLRWVLDRLDSIRALLAANEAHKPPKVTVKADERH